MKKLMMGVLASAMLSSSVMASKARLEALGEDSFGSLFLDDSRNVLLNPAMLNFHKDFITLEWGKTKQGLTDQDSTQTPHAEGGLFKSNGNMVYGLYFGDETNVGNGLRALTMGANAVSEDNNVGLFIAGDAGVQWGVKITRQAAEDDATDMKSEALRTAIGLMSGDWEAFLNVGLINKANVGAVEFNGKSSYELGVTYGGLTDLDIMAKFRSVGVENAASSKYTAQDTDLGLAKTYKLNDRASAWVSAWYRMQTIKDDILATGDTKTQYLPVTIALEVMAKEWLALRGSITNNIIGTKEVDNGNKNTIAETTKVAAGASLIFGDLTVDGIIGNDSGTGPTATDTSAGNGTLRTDSLMSRVSLTYKF